MVECSVMQNILSCSAGLNRIITQFCSINNAPGFDCMGTLDIGSIDLASGVVNISVDITLQSQETVTVELIFLFMAPGI